jgi:hypothetical protein
MVVFGPRFGHVGQDATQIPACRGRKEEKLRKKTLGLADNGMGYGIKMGRKSKKERGRTVRDRQLGGEDMPWVSQASVEV